MVARNVTAQFVEVLEILAGFLVVAGTVLVLASLVDIENMGKWFLAGGGVIILVLGILVGLDVFSSYNSNYIAEGNLLAGARAPAKLARRTIVGTLKGAFWGAEKAINARGKPPPRAAGGKLKVEKREKPGAGDDVTEIEPNFFDLRSGKTLSNAIVISSGRGKALDNPIVLVSSSKQIPGAVIPPKGSDHLVSKLIENIGGILKEKEDTLKAAEDKLAREQQKAEFLKVTLLQAKGSDNAKYLKAYEDQKKIVSRQKGVLGEAKKEVDNVREQVAAVRGLQKNPVAVPVNNEKAVVAAVAANQAPRPVVVAPAQQLQPKRVVPAAAGINQMAVKRR